MPKSMVLLAAAFALAFTAFWAGMLTGPQRTEAETGPAFDVGQVLETAPRDALTQPANVIGCGYILTDGHRCD